MAYGMVTWLWYRTSELSLSCGTGLQNGHWDVVPNCRMVTWLLYWTAELSRGCGTGPQNGHVAVVLDWIMVTWLW
jgi:hypothetical protein